MFRLFKNLYDKLCAGIEAKAERIEVEADVLERARKERAELEAMIKRTEKRLNE